MDIASHAWTLLGRRSCRATILLHQPLDPAAFPNRKALADAAWQAVDRGAADLRQGRDTRPLPPKHHGPAPEPSPDRA
jgi:1-acyl-sn-glycerol-3-phosphate acyltransferase